MKKKFLIAIVDKDLDSNHSFIDNFLLLKNNYFKLILLCETNRGTKKIRNKDTIILSVLKKRFLLNRIYNFIKIYFLLRDFKKKNKLNILVRNDPLALLASSLISDEEDNLIFQSSFPHELNNKFKGFFQKIIFLLLKNKKINLISVSDYGLKRLSTLFPNYKKKMVIPLFSDFENYSKKSTNKENKYITYLGSHSKLRNLKFVIEGIILFLKKNHDHLREKKFKFLFIGSTKSEKNILMKLCGEFKNEFIFIENIKKNKINKYLNKSYLGISIIPPVDMYFQACPTKIVEYLSCKLPIIVNNEIPFQKKIIKNNIGYSVSWNKKSIARGLEKFILDQNYSLKRKRAFNFYKNNFNPRNYQEIFYKKLLIS